MTELALLALLGLAVGAFGTLVGVGGGFLLVPVLLLAYPDASPATLTAMSLLVVCVNATSGSIAYARQQRIDFRSGIQFTVAGLPGSVIGVIVVGYLPRQVFDVLFALLLGSLGVYLLIPRSTTTIREPLTGKGIARRMLTDSEGHTFLYSYRLWQGLALSAGVGFISSLLGIGGGIVHVPGMVLLLHFPVHIATATSQFVLMLLTAGGSVTHFFDGSLGWNFDLARAAAMAVGAAAGAQGGARLSTRMNGPLIVRVLGGALLLVALRLAAFALAR